MTDLDFGKVIEKQKGKISDLLFSEVLKETQIEQLINLVNEQEQEIEQLKNKVKELSPNEEKVETEE